MASNPIRLAVVVIAILALIVLTTKFRIQPNDPVKLDDYKVSQVVKNQVDKIQKL